jgi:hypothetical protein
MGLGMPTMAKSLQVLIQCAIVAFALILPFSSDAAGGHYDFALTKGAGVPVCEAYLKRLNGSDFDGPPYCDRPENTDVPGFVELNRVFLNADEILKLDRQAYGFLMNSDVNYWEKSLAERKRLGLPITTDAQLRSGIQLQLRGSEQVQRHFRFEPPVDIDNDGVRDPLVVWRETTRKATWTLRARRRFLVIPRAATSCNSRTGPEAQ